jgi:hypothetical protein
VSRKSWDTIIVPKFPKQETQSLRRFVTISEAYPGGALHGLVRGS